VALRVALDTNRYIDFARGVEMVVQPLRRAREVFMPFIVLAELRAGFRLGTEADKIERDLKEFLNLPGVGMLFPDAATTHAYADLYLDLRRRNAIIPTNDLWIAALAIQHDLVLFTRDKHFDLVPRLARM